MSDAAYDDICDDATQRRVAMLCQLCRFSHAILLGRLHTALALTGLGFIAPLCRADIQLLLLRRRRQPCVTRLSRQHKIKTLRYYAIGAAPLLVCRVIFQAVRPMSPSLFSRISSSRPPPIPPVTYYHIFFFTTINNHQ